MSTQPSFLNLDNKHRLAYHLSEGKTPTVIFLGGFKSDMQGGKALALEAFCQQRGQRFIRFDYSGHGQSYGKFTDGTIGSWKNDALTILDTLGGEKNILVGSSMGGWIALLLALARPEKISGLITIAAAPDFTERRIWQQSGEEARKELMEKGIYHAPSCYGEEPYPITRKLVEEGRNHLLMGGTIDVRVPVRLLHGRLDPDVPWQTSAELMEKLASDDVELHVIKNAGHRLSEPNNLQLLCKTLEELLSR
ncbi:MAG: alpha/beta hydrolase [Alphaproteobacteria bacterium]|nr:alpha/beta hydrolase [Alphaproteobacteria bacterium]